MCKAPERERLFLSAESPENNITSKTNNFNKFQVRAALSYLAFSLKVPLLADVRAIPSLLCSLK